MYYYIPIIITIVSNVFYHICQKYTPAEVNPFVSLAFTYLTALAVTLAIIPFTLKDKTLIQNISMLNWSGAGLGITIVGLELGFLLAYRVGWKLSLASMISSVCVALALAFVGILFFKEKISPVNAAGLCVCLVGFVMANYK